MSLAQTIHIDLHCSMDHVTRCNFLRRYCGCVQEQQQRSRGQLHLQPLWELYQVALVQREQRFTAAKWQSGPLMSQSLGLCTWLNGMRTDVNYETSKAEATVSHSWSMGA